MRARFDKNTLDNIIIYAHTAKNIREAVLIHTGGLTRVYTVCNPIGIPFVKFRMQHKVVRFSEEEMFRCIFGTSKTKQNWIFLCEGFRMSALHAFVRVRCVLSNAVSHKGILCINFEYLVFAVGR